MLKRDEKATIRIGTRGSDLALWQARWTMDRLQAYHPEVRFLIVEIATRGDQNRKMPLQRAGGTGLFVKALEIALLNDDIDLAVHSLKDMPSRVPPELALAAVPERADPRDVLVSPSGASLLDLPVGARIGTGSPRRKAQLLNWRSDLKVVGIRGNVDTRLRKVEDPDYDAIVLAAAGLIRLEREEMITEILPPESLLPAAGQGALAVETRADDEQTRAFVAPINHTPSWAATAAERGFMAHLDAGCHVPAAAYAMIDKGELWLRGLVASHNGQTMIRGERRGPMEQAEALGRTVAKDLLKCGADNLLKRET